MDIQLAARIRDTGEYLFATLDKKKRAAKAKGVDVVDLGVGDPDLPTPSAIIDALCKAARDGSNHQYPSYAGKQELREAISEYMKRRFQVSIDPNDEAVVLIGSKEGIAHLSWALLDPGDVALVCDPAYPVYATSAKFCGADVHRLPLTRERGFRPDLSSIPEDVANRAKVLWLNYPNNPTTGVATRAFFEEAVEFGKSHDVVVINDASYSEIYLDGEKPIGFLQTPGAKEVGVEFHSLSKTFNMTGWRVGWAAGNPTVIDGLGRIKTNVDSGVFGAVQDAAIAALEGSWEEVEKMRATYARRRDTLCDALVKAGWDVMVPKATFFALAAVPQGMAGLDTATWLLEEAGIICAPTIGMGAGGEGFVRFSLTAADERIQEAARRITALSKK